MFEKVNPNHPDKVADRIAGAIVDLAYTKQENPKVAVEVLIGHGKCTIINETSVHIDNQEVLRIVERITRTKIRVSYLEVPQDKELARNQETLHCGDNGIFKGTPTTQEQRELTEIARTIYKTIATDGKYILADRTLVVCQSNFANEDDEFINWLEESNYNLTGYIINPIGNWTGGTDVDTGATNRKLGSDMGDAVTGGGLHGKDLSKADVSVNIYCYLRAQELGHEVKAWTSIGNDKVYVWDPIEVDHEESYADIVATAKKYIDEIGGFEKLAEWGLIR